MFLAPEVFDSIKSKNPKLTFQPKKNSSFQLGLLVAECLLGQHFSDLYSGEAFNADLLY